jgi:nitrate reductase beta subunit
MLFYVPPLLPVMAKSKSGPTESVSDDFFHAFDEARAPMAYLAKLFGGGNVGKLTYALRKQMAIRMHRREVTVGDIDSEMVARMLREADTTKEEADEIYKLTALCTFEERFVIPPAHREEAIEMMKDPLEHKRSAGFGFLAAPKRGN